jgi:hypothetical protein
MIACKHDRVRELAPTVLWCAACGAHKRLIDAARWSRWVPAGVRRLRPLTAAKRRELEHADRQIDWLRDDVAAELGENPMLQLKAARSCESGAVLLTFPFCKGSERL